MADQQPRISGGAPQVNRNDGRGHPLPRRASPTHSVTLEHHRLARDATMKAQARKATSNLGAEPSVVSRRQSSGESLATTSDPKNWYNRANHNPTATYDDPAVMDVDPPFFQHETDSSNEVLPYLGAGRAPPRLRQAVTQSSSADDYRSVIDDLTIENKRLKEELKRYKQLGPDMMKKEKLFEIKVHGLPGRKKRELEATLRDFAAGLENSSEATATSSRRKVGKHLKSFYNGSSMSKHASSSSSNSRPVDSAYASMSATGQSSAAPQSSVGGPGGPFFHGRPSMSGVQSANQKVENYLEDTPGGLMPRHTVLTDRDKKKLVVRRLEQLFTGKISAILMQPQAKPEAARESQIQQQSDSGRKPRSGDFDSTSGNRTDSRGTVRGDGNGDGNGDGRSGSGSRSGTSGKGNGISPTTVEVPEQRPTRPRDLDPDRAQLPSENMDYIRHLGIVRPDFLVDKKLSRQDVSADADGWVYLNLLCNLAQLHMYNVTPAFIRSAVSEKSAKFQLSADGRKIRWRGGSDGTKFSSDSSSSQRSPSNEDDSDSANAETGSRKKIRTNSGTALTSNPASTMAAASSKDSKLGLVSGSSSGFHYKPIFVRNVSSAEFSTDSSSQESYTGQDEVNGGGNLSKWDTSGQAGPRKRRRDGAIIYYSGAAFCTDLSGDAGDYSQDTHMTSTGQSRDLDLRAFQPVLTRSMSGSSLMVRPLSDDRAIVSEAMDMDLDNPPDLVTDDGDSSPYDNFEFPWCDEPYKVAPPTLPLQPRLEPCGLGGVMPEDHFAVFCQTRHPVLKKSSLGNLRARSEDIAESISGRLAGLSTASPAPSRDLRGSSVEMTYVSGRMIRLDPVALPPPAMFIPPFSTDSEGGTCYDEEFSSHDEEDEELDDEDMLTYESRLANPHLSDRYAENGQPMSFRNDDEVEEDEAGDDDEIPSVVAMLAPSLVQPDAGVRSASVSSVATAGGELESGYSSSVEDNAVSK